MNDSGGVTKFRARGSPPRVGVDGKAMGVERDDGLLQGASVYVEEEKGGRALRLIFGLSGEREPGGGGGGVWL
jgi:hypothetical protein